MRKPSDAARLWMAIEDRLIPALRLTTHERALYYHLLRRTRLVGRRMVRISRRGTARVSGLSTYTARHYLRVLARKQCIRFVDRGATGCLISVRLPDEIFARLGFALTPRQRVGATFRSATPFPPAARRSVGATFRSPAFESFPLIPERDAAGQPRAWPRSDPFRNAKFRARILHRDNPGPRALPRGIGTSPRCIGAVHRCFYCRQVLINGDWTLDHVVPVVRGGSDRASNLVACCFRCNWEKGLTPAEEFLRSLHRKKMLTRTQFRSRIKALHSLSVR